MAVNRRDGWRDAIQPKVAIKRIRKRFAASKGAVLRHYAADQLLSPSGGRATRYLRTAIGPRSSNDRLHALPCPSRSHEEASVTRRDRSLHLAGRYAHAFRAEVVREILVGAVGPMVSSHPVRNEAEPGA